jgi:hypothetical protein
MLYPSTCVRLRYGHLGARIEVFLGSVGSAWIRPIRAPHRLSGFGIAIRICLDRPPTCLATPYPMALKPTLLRHPIAQSHFWWYRNFLPCFPSPTPFGLGLGTDLPWADEPSPGNLRLSANGILTRFIATNTGIISSLRSTRPYSQASLQKRMLPYRCSDPEGSKQPVDSVTDLSPDTFSAQNHLTSELLRTL